MATSLLDTRTDLAARTAVAFDYARTASGRPVNELALAERRLR